MALALGGVAGCASGGSGSTAATATDLAVRLTDDSPPGFQPQVGATGPLDRPAASQAAAADPDLTLAALEHGGFQRGYARVWTSGDSFITILALELGSNAQATEFVSAEVGALQAAGSAFVGPDSAVRGTTLYILSGMTRRNPRAVFCEGLWFAEAGWAFDVRTCTPTPGDTAQVTALAERQDQRARALLGLPSAAAAASSSTAAVSTPPTGRP